MIVAVTTDDSATLMNPPGFLLLYNILVWTYKIDPVFDSVKRRDNPG